MKRIIIGFMAMFITLAISTGNINTKDDDLSNKHFMFIDEYIEKFGFDEYNNLLNEIVRNKYSHDKSLYNIKVDDSVCLTRLINFYTVYTAFIFEGNTYHVNYYGDSDEIYLFRRDKSGWIKASNLFTTGNNYRFIKRSVNAFPDIQKDGFIVGFMIGPDDSVYYKLKQTNRSYFNARRIK